jgi:multiple sugar transport system permease protein
MTLPQLRPALAAAALIDLITAFNALPIVWEMTRGGPGYRSSISSSFMFSLRGISRGQSAALSVADLALVAIAVLAFLAVTRPRARGWSQAAGRPRAGVWPATGPSGPEPSRPAQPIQWRGLSRRRAAAASVAACVVALIFLVPYLEMIVGALRPTGQMFAANVLPTHFTFANFSAVWRAGVGHNLLRSVEIAGGATLIVIVCATAAALHGARQRAGRRPLVLVLAVTAQLLGPVVVLDGLERASARVAASSTLSLIVIDAAFNLGFAIWVLERSFRSVPGGVKEAAALDELTPAGRLLRASLRPGAGAVITAVLVTFVSAWDELAVALTLPGAGTGSRRPLTVVINGQLGQASVQWGHVLAICVIAALPAIVLVGLIEGRLAKGAT